MLKSIKEQISHLWELLFGRSWQEYIGGLIIAILNILLFIVYRPLGATGIYVNWGENFYKLFGMFDGTSGLFSHLMGLLGIVIVLGAFTSALLSREFALRFPPIGELGKGFIGGVLMAVGTSFGLGCTIGGFLSGIPALSAGAFSLGAGFMIGTFIAISYMIWEMEHLPALSSGKSLTLFNKNRFQPQFGVVSAMICILGGGLLFMHNSAFLWVAMLGFGFGFIFQRSRFCIVRAFREPFMTGDTNATVGLIVALFFTMIGFVAIKHFSLSLSLPFGERSLIHANVNSNFWLNGLIGGVIFGIGMTIAGGCAIGSLWRAGEGQVKLWVAIVAFALAIPFTKPFIEDSILPLLPGYLSTKLFLPDYIGFGGAFFLISVLLLLWYCVVKWNEKTGRFTKL